MHRAGRAVAAGWDKRFCVDRSPDFASRGPGLPGFKVPAQLVARSRAGPLLLRGYVTQVGACSQEILPAARVARSGRADRSSNEVQLLSPYLPT